MSSSPDRIGLSRAQTRPHGSAFHPWPIRPPVQDQPLDAVPSIGDATQVELFLHTPSAAIVPLGVAIPTIYG